MALKRKPAPDVAQARRRVLADLEATQLALRSLRLTTLPDELGALTRLRTLYLGNNGFAEVPAVLARLAGTLSFLELGPNPLTSVSGAVLGALRQLTHLDLKQTGLRTLPAELAALPLQTLTLDGNPKLDVEQALQVAARIKTLTQLSLSACALDRVPSGVRALESLERLYLNDNGITELPPAPFARPLAVLGLLDNRVARIPDALERTVGALYFGGNPGARAEKRRFDAIRERFVML